MKIIKYLNGICWPLYVILFFCLVGIFRNAYQINFFGYDYGTMSTKVFIAMIVIYTAQAILILAREPKAWIISAVQVFFCFYVYEDFTFLPVTTLFKNLAWYFAPDMSYGWIRFMGVTIMSALFSLDLLKTYLLYALTEPAPARKPRKRAAEKAVQT